MPNVHLADATERLAAEDRPPSSDDVARAHAEASLAIAYELRTRNNIALLDLAVREGWADDADGRTLRTMIVEAVDLATIAELIDGRPVPGRDEMVTKVDAGLAVMNAVSKDRERIMTELRRSDVNDTIFLATEDIAKVVFGRGDS